MPKIPRPLAGALPLDLIEGRNPPYPHICGLGAFNDSSYMQFLSPSQSLTKYCATESIICMRVSLSSESLLPAEYYPHNEIII